MTTTVDTNYNQVGALAVKSGFNQLQAEARKLINDAAATRTLLRSESGSVCFFDSAAGVVYTLPTIDDVSQIGIYYDFFCSVTITSNSAKVITGSAAEFILGQVNIQIATSATTLAAAFNGSSHVAITMNGSTTGGVIGTNFRLTAISLTQWMIQGTVCGSGSIATPAATS